MEQNEKTRKSLISHYKRYPELKIQDIFKYLHQSSFGCEHLISDYDLTVERILGEYKTANTSDGEYVDQLDGEYSRINLNCLNKGLSAKTLGKLFLKSSKTEPDSIKNLEAKLNVAKELIIENVLPFSLDKYEKMVMQWRTEGYPPLRHSNEFREKYKPAYRVISNEFVLFLPLFAKIDELLKKGSTVVAIDGGSASGKTTLGQILANIYDCNVFHMDDYFLRPEQRTPERYAEVGGNVDRERLLEEILLPLRENKSIEYRRFDCSNFTLSSPVKVATKELTIIEGAYSMHPALSDYYDLSVFLDVSPELQRKRIQKRNTPQMAKQFFERWIPLEETYFCKTKVKQRCDMVISICE